MCRFKLFFFFSPHSPTSQHWHIVPTALCNVIRSVFKCIFTSSCSQKSTLRTLGLLRGHFTRWRAALVATASSVVAYYKKEKKKVTREELKLVGRGCRGVAGQEQKQQLHKCFYVFQRSNMSLCKNIGFPEGLGPVFSSRLGLVVAAVSSPTNSTSIWCAPPAEQHARWPGGLIRPPQREALVCCYSL